MENYEKKSLIGEGSFGRVYKATDKKNRTVALKLIAKVKHSIFYLYVLLRIFYIKNKT